MNLNVGGGNAGDDWRVVVRVATDIRYHTLGEETPMVTYLPVAQNYQDTVIIQVRGRDSFWRLASAN